MEMLYTIFLSIIAIGLLVFGSLVVIGENIEKFAEKVSYHYHIYNKTLPEYTAELDAIIDSEFNFVVVMSHLGKNINMITDFKELVQEIVGNVRKNVTPEYIRAFTKSTNLSKNYIYTYIIRRTELKIMDYIKNNNPLNKEWDGNPSHSLFVSHNNIDTKGVKIIL